MWGNLEQLLLTGQAISAETHYVLINLAYLVSAVLFIFGLKGLAHPRTAVRGNLLGATGMLLAVVVTLLDRNVITFEWIIAGIVIGGAIGAYLAITVQMTAMPQMVGIFNGFGGLASLLVAAAALIMVGDAADLQMSISTAASGLIGAVTFMGSMVAFGKLQGLKITPDNAVVYKFQLQSNAALLLLGIGFSVWLVLDPTNHLVYWLIVAVGSVLGVTSVIRIGGADMPVVIALLNSYSGLAAAATGFVLSNNVLIVAGSLVGASGLILTSIMCKAMNRSLANVLFGILAPPAADAKRLGAEMYEGRVKATSPEEIAMLLEVARRVVFAPGYGMAVAQAQHAVRDLANILEARGVEVEYAIHPVAGRMPGHMNVLLAEADVPYDQLKEMDEINSTFPQTDVAIVLGANDVVNPIARTDPSSPIAGMPILDVDKAKTVVMIKRSLSPGFAGIPNPLFAADNCLMFFSDGKKAILEIIAAVKEL